MNDFQDVCSNSPQFDELSSLAAAYRTDIHNFKALGVILDEKTTGSVRVTIDLGAELSRSKVLNKHRLERCITAPVAKETDEFVRRMCIVLRQTEDPYKTSHKTARHGIHEFRLLPAVSGIISRAVVEAVLLAGGDARGRIAERVVAELDALWVDICLPIVDGERKSLESELIAMRKLVAFVSRLVQMRLNRRTFATIHTIASSEISRIAHTIFRITSDDWFTAARVSVSELLACCSAQYDESIGSRLVAWLDDSGRLLHDSLVADCARIEALRTASDFAPEFYALRLADSADDPASAALIEPPQYMRSFNTESGRIYAIPTRHASPVRTIGVVRVFFALRSLIANGFFPIGKFDALFAKELVCREQEVLTFKNSGILSNLLLICHDFGVAADAVTLDRFVDGIARDRKTTSEREQRSFSGCCAIPSHSSRTSASSALIKPAIGQPSSAGCDFLVRPDAKHKSIDFWPSKVPRASLLEYLVVYSLATTLNEMLSGSRKSIDFVAVEMSNSAIFERVAANIKRLHRTEGSPLSRLVDNSDHGGASINPVALKQMTAHIVKKVIKAGHDGALAAQRATATGAMNWTAGYNETRANSELILHIGSGSRDPACYLFLDLCVRVKSYMDESWPLPEGVSWKAPKPRRGGGSGGGARTKAVPTPPDADETAATVVS